MNFLPEILLISIIGGIVSVDTASGWQVMISQPVVACPIIGLIFGDPQLGLLMGILLELPWLTNVPLGGVHGSEGNLGSVAATGVAIHLKELNVNTENIIVIISIMYSLIISRAGIYLVEYVRRSNLHLIHLADAAAEQGDLKKITQLNLTGLLYSFILGFILILIGILVGILILPPLAKFIHSDFDTAFGMAKYGLLGLGMGSIATLLISKKTRWYLLIPFIAGISIFVLLLIFS